MTGNPEVIPGQKSASGRLPLMSPKPVYGSRDQVLKGARITSALPTIRELIGPVNTTAFIAS